VDPDEDVAVLVWRRKIGGDEMLHVADGKSWRLPRLREIGLSHVIRIEGSIGALVAAPYDFDPGRLHRWVRIDLDHPEIGRAFRQTGAATVVWRRGIDGAELLVLHRAAGGVDYEGDWAWTPPGGGLEPGETHEECAARELFEEAGLDLPLTRVHGHPNDFAAFVCELVGDVEIVLSDEHDRFEWLTFDEACARCKPQAVVDTLFAARRYLP
jgi:8-oxo-dGTP pyrophosphatase MutT (NUDIX family)